MHGDQFLQARENADEILFSIRVVKYHVIHKEDKLSVFIFHDLYSLHFSSSFYNIAYFMT